MCSPFNIARRITLTDGLCSPDKEEVVQIIVCNWEPPEAREGEKYKTPGHGELVVCYDRVQSLV